MKKYIDTHQIFQDGVYTFITFEDGTQPIVTGTTLFIMPAEYRDDENYRLIESTCNLSFFYDDEDISVPFYCVPLIDFFAKNATGYFGTLNGCTDIGQTDSPIYHIGKNREIHFAAKDLRTLLDTCTLSFSKPRDEILLFDSLEEAQKELPFYSVK